MTAQAAVLPMRRGEFIALMAMMFATIAFSIDAMLPALPEIAAELSPTDPLQVNLIISSFVLGMGLGTFFSGPLSDAFGRKRVMIAGAILYIAAATAAWASTSLEMMLIARLFQGLGASGPRVVSVAIIRDLFAGREMARILSIVMIIFTLAPAFAPAMGVVIIALSGWRAIFMAFVVFSVVSAVWMMLRLPETHPVERRRPMQMGLMWYAVRELFQHPTVRLAILTQTLLMAMLFSFLMLIQPIYADIFDRMSSFAFWFGLIALASATASFLNAVLVIRFGMRRLATTALGAQVVFSTIMMTLGTYTGPQSFTIFLIWQFFLFFLAGLTVGNLNAIVMEPMGHIAGMAASVTGAFSTIMAAVIASPIALVFDGTIRPLVGAVLVLSTLGFILMLMMAHEEHRAPA